MVVAASITGVVKTLLIILGGAVLLRFLGQLMIAKRNMEEERNIHKRQRELEKERTEKMKKFGKTSIIGGGKAKKEKIIDGIEDVDFEEV
jgi:hypothetical protein